MAARDNTVHTIEAVAMGRVAVPVSGRSPWLDLAGKFVKHGARRQTLALRPARFGSSRGSSNDAIRSALGLVVPGLPAASQWVERARV